jgi:hypothetical protein
LVEKPATWKGKRGSRILGDGRDGNAAGLYSRYTVMDALAARHPYSVPSETILFKRDVTAHSSRMLLFLASVLEQLDLALEQLSKGDIHYARFGLMLTDNAVELVLHQLAQDKSKDLKLYAWKREEYTHQKALDKALGRNFDAKVKFARIEGGLSEEAAQTITIMHGYRNEVYHVGLKHESILPALAPFYFGFIAQSSG